MILLRATSETLLAVFPSMILTVSSLTFQSLIVVSSLWCAVGDGPSFLSLISTPSSQRQLSNLPSLRPLLEFEAMDSWRP